MNVCRIASAAATQVLNALRLRFFAKALERVSRELDGLHFVWEVRQTGKAGGRVSGSERSRLGGNRNAECLPHLPNDRQRAYGFVLAVAAHGSSARFHHG